MTVRFPRGSQNVLRLMSFAMSVRSNRQKSVQCSNVVLKFETTFHSDLPFIKTRRKRSGPMRVKTGFHIQNPLLCLFKAPEIRKVQLFQNRLCKPIISKIHLTSRIESQVVKVIDDNWIGLRSRLLAYCEAPVNSFNVESGNVPGSQSPARMTQDMDSFEARRPVV